MITVSHRERLSGAVRDQFDELASQIRRLFFTEHDSAGRHIVGTWQIYTPVWQGTTTNPAIGNGLLYGRYARVGTTVFYNITMVAGSTTTFGTGAWVFTLPIPSSTDVFLGSAVANLDTGVSAAGGSSSSLIITSLGVAWDVTNPIAWGSGDGVKITGFYEAEES